MPQIVCYVPRQPAGFIPGRGQAPHCAAALRGTALGYDAALFTGYGLFLTSAAEAGVSIWKMTEVGRHCSIETLRGYVRRADLFKEHAGAAFL